MGHWGHTNLARAWGGWVSYCEWKEKMRRIALAVIHKMQKRLLTVRCVCDASSPAPCHHPPAGHVFCVAAHHSVLCSWLWPRAMFLLALT